jgi:hypothetical protein
MRAPVAPTVKELRRSHRREARVKRAGLALGIDLVRVPRVRTLRLLFANFLKIQIAWPVGFAAPGLQSWASQMLDSPGC